MRSRRLAAEEDCVTSAAFGDIHGHKAELKRARARTVVVKIMPMTRGRPLPHDADQLSPLVYCSCN